MIDREFGKFRGSCDVCGEETPRFSTWGEVKEHMKLNGWKTARNKETEEWENICPSCRKLK